MSIFDDDEPRFLHEVGGIGGAFAPLDMLERGYRNPASADGMFNGQYDHPANVVTNPAGYLASHQGAGRDPWAEVFYWGTYRK